MTTVLLFGGEARTGLAITPGEVEIFETPAEKAESISATATALSRISEGHTLLGEQAPGESAATVATVAGTVLGELRGVTPALDENATVVYVDRNAAVLVTPDGTAHSLPIRTHHGAGPNLATIAKARGPTTAR